MIAEGGPVVAALFEAMRNADIKPLLHLSGESMRGWRQDSIHLLVIVVTIVIVAMVDGTRTVLVSMGAAPGQLATTFWWHFLCTADPQTAGRQAGL